MVKPQSRFKQSRISGTNSDRGFNQTLKTPSELSKTSPHGKTQSQLDQNMNESNKVNFYKTNLISNETLLELED